MAAAKFLSYYRRMPLPTDMTPPQVAEALGCTPPTVRSLVNEGALRAVATKRGSRTFLVISREDVDTYVREHGKFSQRGRRRSVRADADLSLAEEIRSLRTRVEDRIVGSPGLESEVVALRESLQLQRAAMATLLEADADRSAGVNCMREAMEFFGSADAKRTRAVTLLDEVVGSLTLPRSPAELSD